MRSLLEKARRIRTSRKALFLRTPEEIELAIGWMENKVSGAQVLAVMGFSVKNRASLYNFLATAFKQAYEEGKIIIK